MYRGGERFEADATMTHRPFSFHRSNTFASAAYNKTLCGGCVWETRSRQESHHRGIPTFIVAPLFKS
jgi:hypothetical protein